MDYALCKIALLKFLGYEFSGVNLHVQKALSSSEPL